MTQNDAVAAKLREAADILQAQRANPFRIRAYRQAADRIAGLDVQVGDVLVSRGLDGLLELPGIGAGIATAINELVRTGRWSQLERLRGTLEPERLFRSIPGVGPALARHLHEKLEIDTLEALEAAAHDGRLAAVPGIGPRRTAMIRAELATLLGRRRRLAPKDPPVEVLLDVDEEYRRRAASGRLPRIAPRRFNTEGTAWLPILHTERGDWRFTALFSNTPAAHQLGRTRDWVIVYFHSDGEPEGQRTVVTETRGSLAGRRVVRGRERECETYYAAITGPACARRRGPTPRAAAVAPQVRRPRFVAPGRTVCRTLGFSTFRGWQRPCSSWKPSNHQSDEEDEVKWSTARTGSS